MILEEGLLYHVFNRGNNGEKIFYKSANYLYFIEKVRIYLLPHADVLSWCLMPNHFHLMIQINRKVVEAKTINQSLGILLCSYARAVNIQEGRKGSLFQQHTKSICLNENLEISPAWHKIFGITKINAANEMSEYPYVCMNYIHQNPVSAGLVFNIKSWRWSSYHQIHLNDNDIELVNMEALKNVVRL